MQQLHRLPRNEQPLRSTAVDSIKIPSMSNIVADSGIHHGIRRIKPYVLNRNGCKPRARELFQARRAQIQVGDGSRISLSRAICMVLIPPTFIRRLEFSSWKQCLSCDDASVAFYYVITYRNVPANGRKSRWSPWRTTPRVPRIATARESRDTSRRTN